VNEILNAEPMPATDNASRDVINTTARAENAKSRTLLILTYSPSVESLLWIDMTFAAQSCARSPSKHAGNTFGYLCEHEAGDCYGYDQRPTVKKTRDKVPRKDFASLLLSH